MFDDLQLISKRFPEDLDHLNVYAIGDVHVGSEQFDESAIKKKIRIIKEDPAAALCLCGDLGDYGLKNSKTNVYKATMSPAGQQAYIKELFEPVVDKIVAAVPGNHEERITREVGTCPLYDLCLMWGIPEAYRENLAIVKLQFGKISETRQHTYIGIVTHGSTRNKHAKFISCFDGIDFAVSGHTHTPGYVPHGKIRIEPRKEVATHVPYKEIVVDAHLKPGGYGLKKEYEIPAPPELQWLELGVKYVRGGQRYKRQKSISYHTAQI